MPGERERGEVTVARATLERIWSALDRALGDSDMCFEQTDEEMRRDAPLQWAAKELGALFRTAPEPTPEAGRECPRCEGSGEFANDIPCGMCKGTGRLDATPEEREGGEREYSGDIARYVTLCEETGSPAESGACRVHGGDACLAKYERMASRPTPEGEPVARGGQRTCEHCGTAMEASRIDYQGGTHTEWHCPICVVLEAMEREVTELRSRLYRHPRTDRPEEGEDD